MMAHHSPNAPQQLPHHEHPALYIITTSSYPQQVEPHHLPPTRSASFNYTCQCLPPTSSFNLTTPSCYPLTIHAGIGPSFGPIIFSAGPITPPTVLQPLHWCWPPRLTTSTATSVSAQHCHLTSKCEHAHHNHHSCLTLPHSHSMTRSTSAAASYNGAITHTYDGVFMRGAFAQMYGGHLSKYMRGRLMTQGVCTNIQADVHTKEKGDLYKHLIM